MVTRKEVEAAAKAAGLSIACHGPGDGVTRFKVWEGAGPRDFHEGGEVYTALGAREAAVWISGYLTARTRGER